MKVIILLIISGVIIFISIFKYRKDNGDIHNIKTNTNINIAIEDESEKETEVIIVDNKVPEKTSSKNQIENKKSEEIKEKVKEKKKEIVVEPKKSYTDEDLHVLSHVIFGEAGGYSRELQIGVGSVVLNRVKDKRFPNTIKEVVFQNGQYACTWDGNYDREPDQQAIDVAIYLLENGSQYPKYVIFQSQFLQGDSIYKKIGNTYFCYWSGDVK